MKIIYLPKAFLYLLTSVFLLISCQSENGQPRWIYQKTIQLDSISPVGIALLNGNLLLSDVDNNRLILADTSFTAISIYSTAERPMHLNQHQGKVLIPLYLADEVLHTEGEDIFTEQKIAIKPDGISAIDAAEEMLAYTGFYNHKLYIEKGKTQITKGGEGKAKGQLYYPADIQLFNDTIYVADTYNNRVQLFDYEGNALQILAENDTIKEATGLYVNENQLFVTDFGGSRVLIYNHNGSRLQTLKTKGVRPADLVVVDKKMFVIHYGSQSVDIFVQK